MTTMNRPRVLHQIASQTYFNNAVKLYQAAAVIYSQSMEDGASAAQTIADLSRRISDVQAEAIINGEAEGSNPEKRKAALDLWSAKSAPIAEAIRLLRKAHDAKAQADMMRDSAANEMSVQRARQRAHIAHVERETQSLRAHQGDGIEPQELLEQGHRG